MRNIIILTITMFASNMIGQTNWTLISSNTSVNFKDIAFTSSSIGYIVGDNGVVLKTTNNGNNWVSTFSDSTQSFISTSFVNDNIGYVLTSTNLYKTTNGGISWEIKYSDSNFNTVHFINENIGFIGSEIGILKTIDGGLNWNTFLTDNTINSISFPSENIGYFTGGSESSNIYKTINQGESFLGNLNQFNTIREEVQFLNNDLGFLIGWYNPYILKTTNGGNSWTQASTNYAGGMSVHFINELIGYHVDNSSGFSKIYSTNDGGLNWNLEMSLNSSNLYGLKKITSTTAFIFCIGENGIIYKKDNLLSTNHIKKNENDIEIFPNPTSDEINIEYNPINVKIMSINLIDENGKIIENIKSDFEKLRIQNISQGIYFLNFITEKGTISKKFIRK